MGFDSSGTAIWSIRDAEKENRKSFIELYRKQTIENYISEEHLTAHFYGGVWDKLCFFLLVALTIVPLSVVSLFNRNLHAQAYDEIIETYNLLKLCKGEGVEDLYVFCIYERVKNLAAMILIDEGIKVHKVTSEVPLFLPNPEIIASSIITCFAYQNEEVSFFDKSMFFDELETWGPEQIRAEQLINLQTDKAPANTVGFYSSAFWLREKLGHVDLGLDLPQRETRILEVLREVKLSHPNMELQVYLHPLEKRPENLEQSLAYYADRLSTTEYRVMDVEVPSTQLFHETSLGVAVFSTILFERIFLGYNTLLAPFQMENFPIENSPLQNICVHDETELKDKLKAALFLSKESFFDKFEVGHYRSKHIQS